MRILTLYNRYRFRGGEDESTESEIALLREYGHEIRTLVADNGAIHGASVLQAGLSAVWSHASYRSTRRAIREFRPDVVKVHNFFPLLSPSVYYAANAESVPVVQALHNYRVLCPRADFSRNGSVCEKCAGKAVAWPGIMHGCYRDSRAATASVATMSAVHRLVGTWRERVRVYVTPSEYTRRRYAEAGFPADRLVVKPNFLVRDPGRGAGGQRYALFAGRLSSEKGLGTLLDAWANAGTRVGLWIVGDGPLDGEVRRRAERLPNVQVLGRRQVEDVYSLMGEAAFLVFPSECFETFGRVAVEAFAKGTPVVASNLGAMAEVVDDRRTGLLFRAGDAADLAAKVEWMASHPAEVRRMRDEARAEFVAKYTAERNYQLLMEIYRKACDKSGAGFRAEVATVRAAGAGD